MLRTRLWVLLGLLGGGLLAASGAKADDLGFVDCANHPEETQVYAKARKSQDVVATVPCGERFKVVLYGFIFSEIQTSDGKVGFIFSNVMTVERSGGSLQARSANATTPTLSAASDKTKIYAEPRQTPAPAPSQSVSAQPPNASSQTSAPATAPASSTSASDLHGTTIDGKLNDTSAAPQPKAAPAPATLPGAASVLKATEPSAAQPDSAPVTGAPAPAAPSAPQPAAAETPAPAPAPTSAPPATSEVVVSSAPTPAPATPAPAAEPTPVPAEPPAAQPAPAPVAQPQPVAAAPEPEPVRAASIKQQRWEKPNPGARSASLIELYGGFAFSRMSNGSGYSNGTNFLGAMGSFGWNIKPWAQLVGDSSYNTVTLSGVKNVLYGNHFGGRFLLRGRGKWSLTPFGEALIGGSRADAHYPAAPGYAAYTTSQNCISYKFGGGVDIHPTRMFEVRLIDVDYYRTAFGTNLHQTNYWVSSGIVIRLFHGWGNE